MKNENATLQVELKNNWNGKERICVDEIDDVENFAAFRDEWTR